MAASALTAHGIGKRYGDVEALRGLTFAAEATEIIGLLGPNGAGKTTAIRVLTTILPADEGGFSVAGIAHTRQAQIRARIGALPESAGYPESQTGAQFLHYYARLFGQTRESARSVAGALLAEVGLAERASSLIGAYSRGMRQRLGIARALINEPAILFLDEPTLGLDPAGQRQVLRLVSGIARERGATVILSTHFLAEVEEICSRVLILNRGAVVAQGTVDEVTSRVAGPGRGRFRVPPELCKRAVEVLASRPTVAAAQPFNGQVDWVAVTLRDGLGDRTAIELEMTRSIEALAAAGIPIRAFELEGARLSDAFLSVTGEG
jgi:ABC-2 type transport system ATP-binding protein